MVCDNEFGTRAVEQSGNAIISQHVSNLVPQVFGRAADVGIEVRHVDELSDASLSGCLGNLLRDAHKDVLKSVVPSRKDENTN